MPYARREEFVNIGVVGLCAQTGEFSYVLNDVRKIKRVHDFFPTLKTTGIYKNALQLMGEELLRIKELSVNTNHQVAIFNELVKPKDGLLQFSKQRVQFLKDGQTVAKALSVINQDLVGFESKRYQSQNHDAELARNFKKTVLAARHLDTVYKEEKLENAKFGVKSTLPFYESTYFTSIKPLSFSGYYESHKMTEHAMNWLTHLNGLIGAELIQPDKHLIVYEANQTSQLQSALNFALDQFDRLEVNVADSRDQAEISRFLEKVG